MCHLKVKSSPRRKLYEWCSCQQDLPCSVGGCQQGTLPINLPGGDQHPRPTQPPNQAAFLHNFAQLIHFRTTLSNSRFQIGFERTFAFSPATVASNRWTCGGTSPAPLFGGILQLKSMCQPQITQSHQFITTQPLKIGKIMRYTTQERYISMWRLGLWSWAFKLGDIYVEGHKVGDMVIWGVWVIWGGWVIWGSPQWWDFWSTGGGWWWVQGDGGRQRGPDWVSADQFKLHWLL